MKTYRGARTPAGCRVTVCNGGGPERPLDPRFDLRSHSPDGFEWGYAGSGPAQLALALAADLVGGEEAVRVYQRLKFRLVGRLPRDGWELTEEELRRHLAALE